MAWRTLAALVLSWSMLPPTRRRLASVWLAPSRLSLMPMVLVAVMGWLQGYGLAWRSLACWAHTSRVARSAA